MKKTIVLGASTNPERYSYKATIALKNKGHKVYPVGIKKGEIDGLEIINDLNKIDDIDTLTLYIGPKNQPHYYDYILNTIKPKRLILNPGTQNNELIEKAKNNNIEVEEACTLVMLSLDNY